MATISEHKFLVTITVSIDQVDGPQSVTLQAVEKPSVTLPAKSIAKRKAAKKAVVQKRINARKKNAPNPAREKVAKRGHSRKRIDRTCSECGFVGATYNFKSGPNVVDTCKPCRAGK